MKDLNERYWLSIVFSGWRTKQHLSATAFPLFSNRDFLRLLLSVCLTCNKKTNKLEETNFVFLKGFYTVYIKCQTKFSQSKSWKINRHWAFLLCPSGIWWSLHACSLVYYNLLLLDWDESGGLLKQLIKMYEHPLGLGLIRTTVWLFSVSSYQDKTSSRLISLNCPPQTILQGS